MNHFTRFEEVKKDWDGLRDQVFSREEGLEENNIILGESAEISETLSQASESWHRNIKS